MQQNNFLSNIDSDYVIGNVSQAVPASTTGNTDLMTITSDKDFFYILEMRFRYNVLALGQQVLITVELPDGSTRYTSGSVLLGNIGQLVGTAIDAQGSIFLKKPIMMNKGSYIKILARTGVTAIAAGDISVSFHGVIKPK